MNNHASSAFKTTRTLTFREADPAQIMFFANIFDFAHDAYEEFVVSTGFTWKEYFQSPDYAIPLRHAESNFLSPLFAGETYEVAVSVASFGQTSFKMKYVFSKGDKTHAVVTLVHSVLDLKTMKKLNLPDNIRSRFQPYLESNTGSPF